MTPDPKTHNVRITDDEAWDLCTPKAPPYFGYRHILSNGLHLYGDPRDRRYYLTAFASWEQVADFESDL